MSETFAIVQAGFIPLGGMANLLVNTVFPTISTRLDWHLFYQPTALTLAVVPALAGDFNADGSVDAADYLVWRKMSGQMRFGLAADSNFDGVVDVIDYLAWRGNFGHAVPGAGGGALTNGTIPEPSSALLFFYWNDSDDLAPTLGSVVNSSTRDTRQQTTEFETRSNPGGIVGKVM